MMTDDEIKDLANEAGADSAGLNVESASVFAMFKRFAKSIESRTWTDTKARWYQAGVEAEREACAKIADEARDRYARRADSEPRTIDPETAKVAMIVCERISYDIKARGE